MDGAVSSLFPDCLLFSLLTELALPEQKMEEYKTEDRLLSPGLTF
jgi:hypothetical protein